MTSPTKANALREQGVCGTASHSESALSLPTVVETIKQDLQHGKSIRLVDFSPEMRPYAVAAIAQLRDSGFPIRCGWQTLRESHLSQTRLRARTYCIPGEFIEGGE